MMKKLLGFVVMMLLLITSAFAVSVYEFHGFDQPTASTEALGNFNGFIIQPNSSKYPASNYTVVLDFVNVTVPASAPPKDVRLWDNTSLSFVVNGSWVTNGKIPMNYTLNMSRTYYVLVGNSSGGTFNYKTNNGVGGFPVMGDTLQWRQGIACQSTTACTGALALGLSNAYSIGNLSLTVTPVGGPPANTTNLTISVNDTRANSLISGFNWFYQTSNGSDTFNQSGYCASTNCVLTNFTGTLNISVFNVSGGTYFNPANLTSFVYNGSTQAVLQTFSNSINITARNVVDNQIVQFYCVNVTNGSSSVYGCANNTQNFAGGATYPTSDMGVTLYKLIGNLTIFVAPMFSQSAPGGGLRRYYNQTRNWTNFNQSSLSLPVNTSHGTVNITAYRLFLNTSIQSFNVTNNLTSNTTNSGSLILPVNIGDFNHINLSVQGNYSIVIECFGAITNLTDCFGTGVYDNLFQINATDALSGGPVNTFTATLINVAFGGMLAQQSTTNGSVFFPTVQGYEYQFNMDAVGYGLANASANATNVTNYYQFSLAGSNTLFLFFFDQTSLLPIDFQNVSVLFSQGNMTFTNTTNTSEMIAANLTPGLYTLFVQSNGYDPAQYFVTIVNRTTQSLDIFLLNSSLSGDTVFTVKDAITTNTVTGITVTMQQLVAGNYVTIGQETSDAFGVVFFPLVQGQTYQFMTSGPGYNPQSGVFVRTQASYTIIINQNNSQNFINFIDLFSYRTQPNVLSLGVNNFNLTVSSPSASMSWFGMVLSLNGTNTTQNVTGSPSGGTASISMNLTPYQGQTVTAFYYMQSTGINYTLAVSRSWVINAPTSPGNYTFNDFMVYYSDDTNGLDFYSRGILLTIAAVLIAMVLGFVFGLPGAVLGASTVYIFGGIFQWMHPSIVIVIVGALLGSFLIGRRS